MKKSLAIIIASAITAAVFTGCSKKDNSATTSETGSAKKITISMMVSGTRGPSGQDFALDLLPQKVKEAFPNITLESTKMPDDQYQTAIKTKLASGEAPDIFLVWPKTGTVGAIDMAKAGYLMDMSNMKFWDNIAPGAKEDMSYNGKPYAVSDGLDMIGVYYNKDTFKKAGIASEPQNWDEFLAVCEKLKVSGITPIVIGDKDAWMMQLGLYQIAANVLYPQDKDFDKKLQAGTATFSNSAWTKVISMYKELYDKGYMIKNSLGLSQAQATQTFIDGKTAMYIDGTWDYKSIMNKGAVDFERGYMPLPANAAGQPIYVSAASAAGYAINAKTKYPEEVKKIFELMYDGKSDLFKTWRDSNPSISVFKGVPLKNELNKGLYDIYQKGNSFYFCNQMWPGGVADEMEAKFGELISGKGTVEDVVKAMDAKFKQLWKN
ncbi:extracellular solute-binding protein [Clostridium sp. SYSU_GA19001]|uniref:ABC transporter substrate-binding protein n=1 Tax=Clostridium caldaquaticum TaxID=2940653 RepID=UPI0020775D53|nr:extracellular solute-binding protein [Clostridium caldaquaticum]MCM8711894.1 extracellular solute-binding protein [Clostridium caldaquaticum]